MRIARLEDRIKINLSEIAITVSPLSGRQKLEMTSLIKQGEGGKFYIDKAAQEHYLIKHSVKAIEGLKDYDDRDYELSFEPDGKCLNDECAEELLGFLVNTMFTLAYTEALSGIFGEVVNPFTKKKVDGVSVERVIKEEEQKK